MTTTSKPAYTTVNDPRILAELERLAAHRDIALAELLAYGDPDGREAASRFAARLHRLQGLRAQWLRAEPGSAAHRELSADIHRLLSA